MSDRDLWAAQVYKKSDTGASGRTATFAAADFPSNTKAIYLHWICASSIGGGTIISVNVAQGATQLLDYTVNFENTIQHMDPPLRADISVGDVVVTLTTAAGTDYDLSAMATP